MSEYANAAARFAAATPNHAMAILREDGLYRHLVFTDPQGSFYRFDLVTWPNNLMLRGDGFSFAFSVYPTVDLFDLFKASSHHGGINPGYWQEKVTAGRGDVKAWSEDLFRAWVAEEAVANEGHFPGAVEAVRMQILHSDDHSLEYRGTAEYAVASFDHGDFRLRIPDEWEQSFEDFSWEFLFACHAIVWGIAQYDAAPKAAGGLNARDDLRDCFLSDSRDRFDAAADAYRLAVIADRDAQIIAWLEKKADEEGTSNKDSRLRRTAIYRMADKLSRGAVRPPLSKGPDMAAEDALAAIRTAAQADDMPRVRRIITDYYADLDGVTDTAVTS